MGFWDKLFGRPADDAVEEDNHATDTPTGGDPATLAGRPRSADDLAAETPRQGKPLNDERPHADGPSAEPTEPAAQDTSEDSYPAPDTESLSERIRRTPARPMPGFTSPEQPARSASAPQAVTPTNEIRTDGHFDVPDAAAEVEPFNPTDYHATTVDVAEPTPAASSSDVSSGRTETATDAPSSLLPEAPNAPDDDDVRALDNSISVLATAGIHPKRTVTIDDVPTGCAAGLPGFRARPLTTTMELTDADGEFLFRHVSLDRDYASRTTAQQLEAYATDLAEHAGTARGVSVRAVPDPGSQLRGTLNVINGHDVTDIVYDLDPDFGDPEAEEALTAAVAAEGRVAHPILTDAEGERLTAWVQRDTPEAFYRALTNENPQTCS